MMIEFKRLIDFAKVQFEMNKQIALVTIVKTKGSSYRKKGAQMMINEEMAYRGAISGGCVEKAVLEESRAVFNTKKNVIFEYDGQYKLGCNGTIYILIEYLERQTFRLLIDQFYKGLAQRKSITQHLMRDHKLNKASTSYTILGMEYRCSTPDSSHNYDDSEMQEITPQQQLVIIGGEHDSISLARFADQAGFQTTLVVKEGFEHSLPSEIRVIFAQPESLDKRIQFDKHTAIVLMTHSLSKDLNYLKEIIKKPSFYIGVLGPHSRKHTLTANLMDMYESIFMEYADKVERLHGPIGLNIGANTPEGIAISIIAEIIGTSNEKKIDNINPEKIESFETLLR